MVIPKTFHNKLKRVRYFVEANSFERHMLWKETSKSYYLYYIGDTIPKDSCLLDWKDQTGFCMIIGYIKKHPINVNFSFIYLNDNLVCFYYGCSTIVDHSMIDNFLRNNYPLKYHMRFRYVDASNFHLCLDYCLEEHNKRFFFE